MITIALDDTNISPRVQSVLACADALVARGHDVRIVTTADGPVTWRASNARWEFVDDLSSIRAEIDDGFPWREFLIVDEEMYRGRLSREHEPLRVLLDGIGVATGYGAAAHARWFHQTFDLIRVAPYAPSREEPLDSVQEFHVALTTPEMTRLIHSCDLLIEVERGRPRPQPAGLPPVGESCPGGTPEHCGRDARAPSLRSAEAMAAGVPVVSVPDDNAIELGERLIEVLSDEELRDRLRQGGRQAAEQWRAACVAPRLETFLAR